MSHRVVQVPFRLQISCLRAMAALLLLLLERLLLLLPLCLEYMWRFPPKKVSKVSK